VFSFSVSNGITPSPLPIHATLFAVTFTLGILDLFLSSFWLGSHPTTFHALYSFKAGLLLFVRWAVYRSRREHYYFFDLCYAAQILREFVRSWRAW